MPTARYSQPFPVFGRKGWAFGVGPLFSFPTTSEDRFGSGKWQAGAAGAFAALGLWNHQDPRLARWGYWGWLGLAGLPPLIAYLMK